MHNQARYNEVNILKDIVELSSIAQNGTKLCFRYYISFDVILEWKGWESQFWDQ